MNPTVLTETPAGIVLVGESIEGYQDDVAVSKSQADLFRQSPILHYKIFVAKTLPKKPSTPLMHEGTAFHALALEGEEAFQKCKEELAQVPRSPAKKPEFEDKIRTMFDALMVNPVANDLLANTRREVVFRTKTSQFGFPIQARTDEWRKPGKYFVDLKRVSSFNREDYNNDTTSFHKFGYHRQHPFYLAVANEVLGEGAVTDFYFINVEAQEPFQVKIGQCTERCVNQGFSEVVEALQKMKECYDTNVWPGMPEIIHDLDLPGWYYRNAEAE